jgi:hypothetical protein
MKDTTSGSMKSSCGRGQGSLWTTEATEEEEELIQKETRENYKIQ